MSAGRPSRLAIAGVGVVVALALAHAGEIRGRAEAALGRGMPAREAALARGFVLGEDEAIDERTVEDFRKAGLSHLLAVSGQNVALLAMLAIPLLAALGMPLATRLVWVLGAIAVYVPLAGAGPSIVRAGVMGGLSVLATLAGRRASRLYGLVVAAAATLAVDPQIAADVGWQLSFAAVLGILALAPPVRRAITTVVGARGWRRAVADGVAMTIAATVATAPLIAFHFESVSTTTLVSNLLALPAVAPAMWLGMLAAVVGQVPGFPVAAINIVEAPLLAYIAQVASWCGHPSWAYVHVRLGLAGLAASYIVLAATWIATPIALRRRRLATLRHASSADGPIRQGRLDVSARRRRIAVGVAVLALGFVGLGRVGTGGGAVGPAPGLRVSVLDVGQGDASLLQPARAPAVLVDGGPPGDDLAAKLGGAGVDRLGVAVVTHEQSDHAGGIEDLLGRVPIERLVYARLSRRLRSEAEAVGAAPTRIAEGGTIRSGSLRLEALWPPAPLLAEPLAGADPNTQAVVLLARWHDFSMLLTADAEAEEVPVDVGIRRRPQGRPPWQRGCGSRRPARPDCAPVGGDFRRRRQSLRPPDRRHAGGAGHPPRSHAAHRPRRHDRPRCPPGLGRGRGRRLNESTRQYWDFHAHRLVLGLWPSMGVVVYSKLGQAISQALMPKTLLGDGMLVRLRSTTIGILGAVAAMGLGLVAVASQQGWPGVFSGPLPQAPAQLVENDPLLAPVLSRHSRGESRHRLAGSRVSAPTRPGGNRASTVPGDVQAGRPLSTASPDASTPQGGGPGAVPQGGSSPPVAAPAPAERRPPSKGPPPPESPGPTGSSPGRSGEAPGHASSAPGHSGEAPGHSGEAPGHSGESHGGGH